VSLLISAFHVATIIGMSSRYLALFYYLLVNYGVGPWQSWIENQTLLTGKWIYKCEAWERWTEAHSYCEGEWTVWNVCSVSHVSSQIHKSTNDGLSLWPRCLVWGWTPWGGLRDARG
jgi:hypothetical protein